MGERSEPKQVCRRSALAFLGHAAAFGLVASSAVLPVSQAEAQATTTPTTPTTPPTDTAKSGTERRQERERGALNGVRNDERDAQSGVRSDGTRATAPPPPSKKSNRSFGPTAAIGPPQRGPQEGRTARRRCRAILPWDSGLQDNCCCLLLGV
jgi:hypothetical protein